MRLLLILSMVCVGAACSTSNTVPKCSTSNCTGCCDVLSDECLPGTLETACGTGGLACAACGTDTFCSVGFCIPNGGNTGGGNGGGSGGGSGGGAGGGSGGGVSGGGGGTSSCGPETCGGCCMGDVCVPGNLATACGSGGQACSTCTDGQCSDNQCTGSSACNPNNCQGCCNGDRCETGLTAATCGAGGAACTTCGAGQTCNSGRCSGSSSCNEENCDGCCMGNVCVGGNTTASCGSGGRTCGVCASGQSCNAGVCTGGSTCNATTCPNGCCANGVCQPGTSTSACGGGGAACSACSGADSCVGGACRFVCNATTCPNGCCEGNVCRPGNTSAACGTGGGECSSCGASETCNGAACVSTCNATNCPSGCCQGNVCQPGNTLAACGSGGSACAACASGQSCNGTSCVAACNSTNCPGGCCEGSVCQAGTTSAACGSGGAACATCGSNTVCNGTSCVATCNANTCPNGCCQGDVCLPGTSTSACGSGGGACTTCSGPQTCTGQVCSGGGLAGDRCDNAPLLSLPFTVSQSLVGFANDFTSSSSNGCRGTQGLDRVVRVSVPSGQRLSVTVTPTVSTFDPTLSLVVGSASACVGSSAQCAASSDTGVANEAETATWTNGTAAAATVFIIVDDYSTTAMNGAYTLSASLTSVPAGESCELPVTGASNVAVTRTLSSYVDDYQGTGTGCSTPSTGPDFVIAYSIPHNRSLTVTASPASGLDVSLNLATSVSACGSRTCVAGVNAGGTGSLETTGWNNTTGSTVTVYVIVDATSGASGSVTVTGVEGALLGCGAITCPNGCCSAGQCVAGTSNSACGSGGLTCNSCTSPAQCSSSRTCSATDLPTGSACTAASQCYQPILGTAECRTSWPGGYCTGTCFLTEQLCGGFFGGASGWCTPSGQCLESCSGPGGGQSTCRTGYLCDYSNGVGSQGVCVPRCQQVPCGAGTCSSSGYCR